MAHTQVVEKINKTSAERLKKALGARIRSLRERAGYDTIEAFAENLGKSISAISQLERGANWISPELMAAICEAIDQPAALLFADELPAILKPTPEEALAVIAKAIQRPKLCIARPAIARISDSLAPFDDDQLQNDSRVYRRSLRISLRRALTRL